MTSADRVEHFVTLFDHKFLPMGMALHGSLMAHAQPFHLWILCMDELAERQLERLSLPHATLMPLRTVETEELLKAKQGRSRGEYCWTLTPFSFQAVFDRAPQVERVTYLDADLFLLGDPLALLDELDAAGKQVLITEHAFAPEYLKWMEPSGRFCVQFLTFTRSAPAAKVMHWWQARCLEWCFARHEEGRFGDQKYLDLWPETFADEVHVVRQTEKTLAPWNVRHLAQLSGGRLEPVFYHFHEFRIIARNKARCYESYEIGEQGMRFYDSYLAAIRQSCRTLQGLGLPIPCLKEGLASRLWQLIGTDPRIARIE